MENSEKIKKLESQISDLRFELEEVRILLEEEKHKLGFYQKVADFAFAWELWFEPGEIIKYCSPSSYDLTGYTPNEIIGANGIDRLLVYEPDREKYRSFLQSALSQSLVSQSLEFRILTRTKQLRWCVMNVRGVYDKLGKYLGIRASVQDITRLKRAMGQISDLERGKEFEQRNKQRLQSALDLKEREVVSFLLQLSQKNELFNKLSNLVSASDAENPKSLKHTFSELEKLLENTAGQQVDWSAIENQVEKIHPGFLDRMQAKHPNITHKDKRLCSYVRMGLSSKEIAGLLNLTYQSVEIARVRLRKKLKLGGNTRLSNYLMQV